MPFAVAEARKGPVLDPRQWASLASLSSGAVRAMLVESGTSVGRRGRLRPALFSHCGRRLHILLVGIQSAETEMGGSDDGNAHMGIDKSANFGVGFLPLLGEPD